MGFITTVFDLLPLCTQSLANRNISCNKTSQWAHSHLFFPLSRKDDSRLVIEMKNRIYPLLPHTQDTRCSLQPPHIRTSERASCRTDCASSHHVPTLEQHVLIEAHGERRSRQVIGIRPGLKLNQNQYQQCWKASHNLVCSQRHRFILLTSLVLLALIHAHICMNRLNRPAQTNTHRTETTAVQKNTTR